jgi:hypothetical protein
VQYQEPKKTLFQTGMFPKFIFGFGKGNNYLVLQVGKNLHHIKDEMIRWRTILEIPYREYLYSK